MPKEVTNVNEQSCRMAVLFVNGSYLFGLGPGHNLVLSALPIAELYG